jgi:hypothetical protein
MIRGKTLRRVAATVAAVFVLSLGSPAAAADSLLLSLLLPGLGQAQEGHYTKASLFGTAALVSWGGLFATQVNYARAVERYEDQKRIYLGYQTQLDRGETVYIGDVNETYATMDAAYEEADDKEKWRNLFIGTLIATYALNVVDILMTEEDTGEVKQKDAETSLEWNRDGFRLVRTIRF